MRSSPEIPLADTVASMDNRLAGLKVSCKERSLAFALIMKVSSSASSHDHSSIQARRGRLPNPAPP